MEDFRLPSPARNTQPQTSAPAPAAPAPVDEGEEEDEDDPLAAEMEAAFQEAAIEERTHQYSHNTQRYVQSDDESEVSEEE